jgi:hypothetical protein
MAGARGPAVSVTALLTTEFTALLTVTWYVVPVSAKAKMGVVWEALVAPEIGVPFLLHWYWMVAEPVAVTVKVAERPTGTV